MITPSDRKYLQQAADHMIRSALDEKRNTTFRHLVSRYGFATALIKFSGEDPETLADVAAWNHLGAPR